MLVPNVCVCTQERGVCDAVFLLTSWLIRPRRPRSDRMRQQQRALPAPIGPKKCFPAARRPRAYILPRDLGSAAWLLRDLDEAATRGLPLTACH